MDPPSRSSLQPWGAPSPQSRGVPHMVGLGWPEEPSRCWLPPEHNLGAILQGKDPANCRHCLGLAEHQTHPNLQPGIPNLPHTPAAVSSRCSGNFFFQAGKKIRVGSQESTQKAAGIRSEPPPRDIAWDGDAGRYRGVTRGNQGCQKPPSRAMSRARAAVLWAGGMKRVVRTQHCKNQLH